MPKYQIESPDGAKYLIESQTELDSAQLAQYAVNPNGEVPASTPPPAPEQKEGYLSNLGKYWTEDIPEAAKGLADRTVDRANRIEKRTTLGDMANNALGTDGVAGQIVDGIAGTPERVVRTVAGAAGTIGDIAGTVLNLAGNAVDNLSGDNLSKVAKPIAEKISEGISNSKTVQDIAGWYDKLPEADKANLSSTIDLLELLGFKAPGAINNVGEVIESSGKKVLRSGMKVKDKTAKLAGRNVDDGVEKIVDDIAEYGVTSKTGGYKGIAEKAQGVIDEKMTSNSKLLNDYATQNPTAGTNVTISLNKLKQDILDGKVKQIFTNEEEAASFIDKMNDALERRKLHGYQTIDKLPEIKSVIKDGLDAFSDGKFAIGDAPMKELIGDLSYLKLTDELGAAIPEYNVTNKQIHDLINVKTAALEASKRVGNKNVIGLTDALALIGGGPALQSMGIPSGMSTVAPLVAAGVITKKAVSNGRGASALIDAGKTIKKVPANGSVLTLGAASEISESASEYINSNNIQSSGLSTEFRKWFNSLPKGSDRAKAYKEFQTAFKNKRRSKE